MPTYTFPKGFLWGTALAAYQCEGNNIYSDWWEWEKTQNIAKSGRACDHLTLYEQDFELSKDLGHNSHRLSIEWARIFPEENKVDYAAIEHYIKVLRTLKNKGFTTFVTLFHFTLPAWFSKKGGFLHKKNLKHFLDYVDICTKNFSDYADFWITINEPTTYVTKAYIIGIWPPNNKNVFNAIKVYLNLCAAHNAAFKLIKNTLPQAKVGAAHQLVNFTSAGNIFNNICTVLMSFITNNLFYVKTKNFHDFLGINYYFSNTISLKNLFFNPSNEVQENILMDEANEIGWTMKPEGIFQVLKLAKTLINKPIYILEHGISDHDDSKRANYIKETLKYVHKAIGEGIDIRGYLHWTLMDNYEWNLGYVSKFGLIHVDFDSLKRTPKKSAYVYKEICETNMVEV